MRNFLIACCPGPLAAQEPVFSAAGRVVTLFATVRDSEGRLVRNLNKEDFTLLDDGNAANITFFSRDADEPLAVGLLIDTSSSQFTVLERERRAAYRFLDRILVPDRDSAFVVKFDARVRFLCGPTSSLDELRVALGEADFSLKRNAPKSHRKEPRLKDIAGGTKLQTAVKDSCDNVMRALGGRKALLLLTDGVDTASRTTLAEAIEHARRSDTSVYSILYSEAGKAGSARGFSGSAPMRASEKGASILSELALRTGGRFFTVTADRSLEQVLDEIEAELTGQYSIGFTPAVGGSGEYRRLSLRISGTMGNRFVVHSRDGYFAR